MKNIVLALFVILACWSCQSDNSVQGPLTAEYEWFGWKMEIPKGWTLVEAPENPALDSWDKLVSAQKDSSRLLVLTSKAHNYSPGKSFGDIIAEGQKTFVEIKAANSFMQIDSLPFTTVHLRKFKQPGQAEPNEHEFWAEWKSKNDLFLFGMLAPNEEAIEEMKEIALGSTFERRE